MRPNGKRAAAVALVALVALPAAAEDLVARGDYLVRVTAACGNCHTPFGADGAPDMSRELGARLVESVPTWDARAPNITPHPTDGIGAWSDAEIRRAIREGVRPDGTVIGPPMPIGLYRGLADADLDAIVAFPRTLPPVAGKMERSAYRVPLPPSYGPPVGRVEAPDPADRLAYGAYLAGPVAHCVECHSPAGPQGAPDWEHRTGAGGFEFHGPWGVSVSANLTPHPDGLARWTDAEVAAMIRTGVRPNGQRMAPPMGFAFYARMTDADMAAILAYLRAPPPRPLGG